MVLNNQKDFKYYSTIFLISIFITFCSVSQSSDDNIDLSIKTSAVNCATGGTNAERTCSVSITVRYDGEESSLDLAAGSPQVTNGFRPSVYIRYDLVIIS